MKAKSFLLFVYIILFVQVTISQDVKELTILGKPKKLENEIISRKDQNGKTCAAIIVISDMDGFGYESNDGIIGLDDNVGKDIVYLTASERVLEVHLKGYTRQKIILSEYGIVLKPGEVWEITIAGEEVLEPLSVTIKFTPPEAIIMIDSQLVSGYTHLLYPGVHKIQIEKAGFQTIEKEITVEPKNLFFEENLELVKKILLQIETIPSNASIFLNNIPTGVTPFSTFYPTGNYSLKIYKDGYIPIDETLSVIAPKTSKIYNLELSDSIINKLSLHQEEFGLISINTYEDADVYFNNQLIPFPKNIKLFPQKLTINVLKHQAEPIEQIITLNKNDSVVLDIFPPLPSGTLQIAITPFNAITEIYGFSGEKLSSPDNYIYENLPIGTYTLKVTCSGYDDYHETIFIEADKILNKRVILNPTVLDKPKKITWGPRFALTVPTLSNKNDSLKYKFSTGYEVGLRGEFFRNKYFYVSLEADYDHRAIEIETQYYPHETIIIKPNYLSMSAIGSMFNLFEIGYSKKILLNFKEENLTDKEEYQPSDEGIIAGIYHHFLNDDLKGLGISAGLRVYLGSKNAFDKMDMGKFRTISFWIALQF
jgi:hypothetical protein